MNAVAVQQIFQDILALLDNVLGLEGRGLTFLRETRLLGAIAELDSMAVVTLIGSLEDRFGITIDDDEISGDTFATVAALVDFVVGKLA